MGETAFNFSVQVRPALLAAYHGLTDEQFTLAQLANTPVDALKRVASVPLGR